MRIGINLFPLEREKWSGIEIYTYQLIKYLNQEKLELETYSLSKIPLNVEIEKTLYKSLGKINPSMFSKLFYNLYGISKQATNPDVYHSTSFGLPYFLKAKKKVITIHDFAFYKHPELFDFKTNFYYKLILEHSIKNADRIICVSKSCLEDFEYYFTKNEYKSKLRLIYNGFNNLSNIKIQTKLDYGQYILCVGASHERKNLKRILESFCIIRKFYPEMNLIITGSDNMNVINNFCSENSDLRGVKHLKYVSDSELVDLYKNAKLLMYPSIYEGFGFPILEAMSSGTPVLTSFSSSCGEISGYPKEFLANPTSVEDIVLKTKKILEPKVYKHLIQHGYNRVNDFSWEKMGKETQLVYKD